MTQAAVLAQMGSQNQTFRNRIINGAMMIDQRNAGASVSATSGGQYFVDRWCTSISAASKFTAQQSSTAPAGFAKSLLITSSTAWTVGATDYATLNQFIEGFNVADLGWGAVGASTVTLSFSVRSSLTGTFGGVVTNATNAASATRSYPFTYTISAANTWEQKTVTIAGDTSGTWGTSNAGGVSIQFSLAAGSSQTATANTWTGVAAYYGATGQTNILATNGATFYITGVQLEAGTNATPFEQRLYGTELALCQRYYQKTYDISVAPASITQIGTLFTFAYSSNTLTMNWRFKVEMRATPTVTAYSPDSGTAGNGVNGAGGDYAVTIIRQGTSSTSFFNQTIGNGNFAYQHAIATAEL